MTDERTRLEGREVELRALARIATVASEEADRLREHSAARGLCDVIAEVLPTPAALVFELEHVQHALDVLPRA